MSMRLKSDIEIPTLEEDADITAAASSDPDNRPLTDVELAQFRDLTNHSDRFTSTLLIHHSPFTSRNPSHT